MQQIKTILLLGAMSAMLAACASSFRSDVSSFHQLPRPSGETIAVEPMNPELKGSLEFASYADQVLRALEAQGYRRAGPEETPDLVARMDYAVDDGRVIVRGTSWNSYHPYWRSYYGWWGYGHRSHWNNDVRSYTVYSRSLSLEIVRQDAPDQNLFESTVLSDGRGRNLTEVMPLMVEAMFTDFPGPSGSTRRVDIPLEN